jgi:phenylacetate-CoA ligase
MSQALKTWLDTVLKYKLNPDKPGSDAMWSPDLERASRARIREIQSEKLAAAFRYLYEDSAYYRTKFQQAKLAPVDIRSVDDLHKIPITTKIDWAKDQQEHPPWGTFSPLTQERWTTSGWMMFTSSGTTTDLPRVFRHTLHDRDTWAWLGARAYWSMGVRPGDIVFNCFGYGPSVAFWCLHYGMHVIGAPVLPGGGMNTQRRAMFINTYEPTVLACTPSYALYLGRAMEELGMSPEESSIRLVITAGEPGPCVPATKRRIEDLWGAELHDDFGCTEVAMTPLGYTCATEVRQKDHPVSTHLMDDAYISEVVHPETLEPVAEGKEGVLVVSNLFSESQPMLRYMMGDWTAVTTEPCACGRTHARAIGGLHGRSDGMIKVRGIAFFPSTIEDSIRRHPDLGDEFQVEINRVDDMDRVKITVEPQSAIPKDSYLVPRDRIQKELKGALGIDVDVELVPFGSLPRTSSKSRRVIDRRDNPFRGDRQLWTDDQQTL